MRLHVQEFFIEILMKSLPYFINTDGQTFGSSVVSVFRKFEKVELLLLVKFSTRGVAEQGFNTVMRMRSK